MAPNILSGVNEEVFLQEADLTEFALVIRFRGQNFRIACSQDRIIVSEHPEDRIVGFVRRGSEVSGAIWLDDKCVADYMVSQPGKYCITEIKDTFRVPENEIETDPVLYLLNAAWSNKEITNPGE